MSKYRNKNNPLSAHTLPRTLSKGDKLWVGAPGAELSPAECVFYGEYRDISLPPEEGYQLGDVATWDEEAGTVTMNVVPIPPRPVEELIAEINVACDNHIYKTLGWEVGKQLSASLGVYPPTIGAACRAAVDLTIAESDRCSALAREGKSYTPKWPVAVDGALSYKEASLL